MIDAITAYLARHGHRPDAGELARVIGESTDASGCVLTIAGRRHQWGTGDGWSEHPIEVGNVPPGALALTADATCRPNTIAGVLVAPVRAIALADRTDQLRRAGDATARALLDERWRTAAEMEHERRRLERDLHDGAQHHLVALRLSLAIVEHGLPDGVGQERIADLVTKLDEAEHVLLRTAAGILPEALVATGLAAALHGHLAEHRDVHLDVAGLRYRYPQQVEAAVYFVVLEAVNNAHKHAPGARITVFLRDSPHGLEFAVSDDGPGFDVTESDSLRPKLTARTATVGGLLDVRSAPGQGTTIRGVVPR